MTPMLRVGQGFAGADIRSIGARQWEDLPAGSADSANGLLRYAACAWLDHRQKEGPPGVEARRPCRTAWCDQISTPAENQLRFLFGTHLCP
jgi:hypothetical protein